MRDNQPQIGAASERPAQNQVSHGPAGVKDELDDGGCIPQRCALHTGGQPWMNERHRRAAIEFVEHGIQLGVAQVDPVGVGQQQHAVQPQRP